MLRALRTGLLLCASAGLLALSGCGLLSQEFTGEVKIAFKVINEENTYASTFIFDPNDNEDVRENRDSIDRGQVTAITLLVTSINSGNEAQYGRGELKANDTVVSSFDLVPIVANESYRLSMTSAQRQFASELAFDRNDPIEFDFVGSTDQGPIHLDAQAIFRLEFDASL
jgi:hypothetical protein